MCISRVCTCIHVKYTCIHGKYTGYTPGNGLVVFATLKNPYIDPSHISEASEIFLLLILKNDPCLKNGTLKLFLCNFWPRTKPSKAAPHSFNSFCDINAVDLIDNLSQIYQFFTTACLKCLHYFRAAIVLRFNSDRKRNLNISS